MSKYAGQNLVAWGVLQIITKNGRVGRFDGCFSGRAFTLALTRRVVTLNIELR